MTVADKLRIIKNALDYERNHKNEEWYINYLENEMTELKFKRSCKL